MRKTLLIMVPLLLAGCIKQSASYYVGDDARAHTISVLAEQEYFWDKRVSLRLVVARLPDCQRAIPLAKRPPADVAVELFATGENVYTVRSGNEVVQFETGSCTQLAEPAQNAMGQAVGVFRIGTEKMDFERIKAVEKPPAA